MDDYRSTLNTVGWVLATFSTLFVIARVYTRGWISTAQLGWDDWCMVSAWIFAIICTALVTAGTTYGFGQHIVDIENVENRAMAGMYVLLAPCFSILSAFFTKTSIIIAFMRIIGSTKTWVHKLIAWLPLVILFVGSALACGTMIFFCWPIQKSWRPYLEGSCMDPIMMDIVGRGVSAYNALMDVFCAIVPYFLIRNLNIPRKDKRNLVILMGGSIFGAVATIMKIVAMSTISNVADITHSWSEITVWYLTENHVLIITGSFPALRPFWRVVVGKYSSYRSSNKSSSLKNDSRRTQGDLVALHTIGSTPREKRVVGPYSVNMRDSSEESLTERKYADTESLEGILNYGDHRAKVSSKVDDKRRGGESETSITVTREVEII
ncbi:hypothetical protein BKA66DRAFT_102943 [Pyrenochaeta sp. MPI-SDFR-AT-0127]|nr:hypothetical protein BKA66DRAFT_102943 [Pyrenochaeta sp. MPI-SDFR-AT-0127]